MNESSPGNTVRRTPGPKDAARKMPVSGDAARKTPAIDVIRKIKIPSVEDVIRKTISRPQPAKLSPMLAVLAGTEAPPPEKLEGWIFEPKLDGQRCMAFKTAGGKAGAVRLLSRNGENLNGNYPELLPALLGQPVNGFIVDGEVVALKNGLPSFSQLQPRMQISDPRRALLSGIEVFYYIFDLLYMEGRDLMALPLWIRKGMLENAFLFSRGGPLRYTRHSMDGRALFRRQCGKGMEGIIAKRALSPYVHKRSSDWLKFKCAAAQEFIICGYTDPKGPGGEKVRTGAFFGALLLGYYDNGRLAYSGKVGTGFDERTRKSLYEKLSRLETGAMPFAPTEKTGIIPTKGVHWVRPNLVCEISFGEWTRDGLLRHPSFKGLRTGKRPEEVRKESFPFPFKKTS